ncbi:MAG: hypothetical protein WC988_02585 [Patescibacteria group bacterium]
MLGSVLILSSNKKERLEKAWELLSTHGFKANATSPDLLVVQKESEKKSIGIAQAKEVKKFLQERPFRKKIKAVVVEDAQLLTDDAQGSLLKILEEPPTFALIILLCDKEGSLLPTVVSRCQKMILRGSKPEVVGLPQFDLAGKSYEELFDLAKEVSQKDKDEIIEFLEGLLRFDVIASRINQSIINKLEKAIKEIKETNVAHKFALEYLFLMHKAL